MILAPRLNASPTIQIHAYSAMAALALGAVQFSTPKGTLPHRAIGTAWVLLMLAVCISSFSIHTIRLWCPWSPIHLLSIFTLGSLPLAVFYAHCHDVPHHRLVMISIYTGGLVIAGLFTFVSGRIMHAVLFGS